MKRTLSLILSAVMLLTLTMIPAMAASDEASAEASAEAEEETVIPDPVELIEPGMQYFETATIGGADIGGGFYVYGPQEPHTYDMLSSFLNGVIFVYPDKPIADVDEAAALVADLGLDEIAEGFPAYIVIPEPADGESWSEADVDLYWNIQYWLAGGEITLDTNPPQGEYVRHTMNSLQYVIGEGSGATFINNYLSQNAMRIAGIATFGGEIDPDLPVGLAVPAYLVNASDEAVSYWKTADKTDTDEGNVSYDSAYTQQKVVVAEGTDSFDKENIQTAWSTLLSRTMRLGVGVNVVITDTDQSNWVLMDWLELDEIGLDLQSFEWNAETGTAEYYDEYKTKSADSVHLYVPESVENDPDTAVPLVVCLHGMSDDPLNVVVGCGWAQKAVDEGFIVLSPATEDVEYVMGLIEYVESLYNIDTSRIYATGFSMGGGNTSELGKAHPEVFAAIAPMGAAGGSYVEGFDNEAWDLPVCAIVGGIDTNNITEDEDGNQVVTGISDAGITSVAQAFEMNEMDPGEADYAANPFWGYTPDEYIQVIDKDLHWDISNFYRDDFSCPMVQLVILEEAAHSNADYMATVAWDFLSHFSRAADGSLVES